MKRESILIFLIPLLALSCVKNDIPYPVVVPHILTLDAEGAKSVEIDNENMKVNIVLEENVDLKNVRIKGYATDIDEPRLSVSDKIEGRHDLTSPWTVTLSTWQDYQWTISAERPVERYFTVEGQVGATVMDVENRRAIAYASKTVNLSDVKVKSLKLGPKGVSTYSLNTNDIRKFVDADGNATSVEIEVSSFGDSEYWTLFVEHSDISVSVKSMNVWTKEVYLTAVGVEGQSNGFRYRVAGASGWTDVSGSAITTDGGQFTAHITELLPETTYEFYAYTGDDMTDVARFTTDPARQFPNNSFEHFSKVTDADYYKWYDPLCDDPESREIWWACGNGEGKDGVAGTGTLGLVLTYPDGSDKMDGGWSVRCESKSLAGVLACGNLFTGRFAKIIGTTGGAVNYGRPWTTRPKALRVWYKYQSGVIDIVGKRPVGDNTKIGDNDRCEIAISVGNWDYKKMGGVPESPVYVNTTDGIYYTSKSQGVIGFGHLVSDQSCDWTPVEIPLEYKSLTERPTHIIVTCAASYLGDYLTGSSKTKLWIDKMELIY
mgnify:FL=1